MNQLKLHLVLQCLTVMLLLISTAGAAYDVVSNISSNSTEYTTSSSYGELHNISLATGTGTTFLAASWDARVNFTAPLYGRFLRDGVSLGRFNLTQNVYATVGSYQVSFEETAGTHNYGWEVYSNKKGTIYSRNFSAFFLVNGSYGSESTYNSTYDAYSALITTLQNNDTADRVYVNDTFLPIGTYSGDFPNTTIVDKLDISTYAGDFPNTTIANLDGDYPNSTLVNYLPIATYSGNFPNSSLVNYLLTSAYSGDFPNNTVAGNLANWNATYNSTYAATTTTVDGNLATWNATYNATYADGGLPILFTNGSSALAAGWVYQLRTPQAGIITALYADSIETGSINITVSNATTGTGLGSVLITSSNAGSTTGLSAEFCSGCLYNYTIISNTGIKQVSFMQKHTKT